ncbi:ATP-binding protein [Micromonospora sp. NPDC049559]|uniref:sensor histidine kinase n=1 Tax=Micromonospora sp. NPDC049559 TaxID=3155923 RepID=UPI0034346753
MDGRDRLGVTAAGAGLASMVADAVVLAQGRPYPQGATLVGTLGLAEPAVLLVLSVLVVRRSRAGVAVAAGASTGLAVPLWLLRFGPPTWSAQSVGGYAAWATLSAVAVAVGAYLRGLDGRRAREAAAARRAQRLELADDLHDFVVHDINEMLLQAQAGLVLVDGAAAGVADVLRRIERTALRALTTVDRTVHLLHRPETPASAGPVEPDPNGAPRLPKPTMDDLPELVDRFAATGSIRARLDLDPGLLAGTGAPSSLPPEIATTVYRIVVEALTNVRRHAVDAGHVRVTVARAPGGRVRVEITDDGRNGGRADTGPGHDGGHGLAGLAARLDALGGTLSTGPAVPLGWRVTAVLPLRAQPTAPAGR